MFNEDFRNREDIYILCTTVEEVSRCLKFIDGSEISSIDLQRIANQAMINWNNYLAINIATGRIEPPIRIKQPNLLISFIGAWTIRVVPERVFSSYAEIPLFKNTENPYSEPLYLRGHEGLDFGSVIPIIRYQSQIKPTKRSFFSRFKKEKVEAPWEGDLISKERSILL